MSNPWDTTPADLALTPFYELLKSFESNYNRQVPAFSGSSLIAKLREADKLAEARRESQFQQKAIEIRPELKQCMDLEQEMDSMFTELSGLLDKLNGQDHLSQAYLRVFHSSQVVWDDISHENKAKLVQCIRSAINAIFKQIQARQEEPSFSTHQKVVSDLIDRTSVFDETKEFDDFFLEDLYDLLTECANSLELIKRNQPPKAGRSPLEKRDSITA
jgi:hypothetical protein